MPNPPRRRCASAVEAPAKTDATRTAARSRRGTKRVYSRQLPTPNFQCPSWAQVPIPGFGSHLEVGIWEWLGRWESWRWELTPLVLMRHRVEQGVDAEGVAV